MKAIIFSTLILVLACKPENTASESDNWDSLTKNEMLEDYEIFQSIYKKANAGLYKYHTKAEIDSVFAINKNLISEKTTYREFYGILWNAIDYTGSCHNALTYADSIDRELAKQEIFFPIPLSHIGNKLYTNFAHKDIPVGSEIISVNNIPENQFSKLIAQYVSTDGFNKTGKFAFLQTDWLSFYIYLALGKQEHFDIKFKDSSDKIKHTRLHAVNYNAFIKNYQKRHSRELEELKSEDYSFKYLDSINIGVLTVSTFGMGGEETEEHKKYSKFLDSVFADLKQRKTPKLIVDIRGNGGGDDPNDILLYSYLTQRDYRENISAFTIFNQIPFSEYYIDEDKEGLMEELENHSILKDGKYYQDTIDNPIWHPNKNAFKGQTILLIDPFVASAGSLFASMVKSEGKATVIGEETLGGYYGHTGHLPIDYKLPNSKLILSFFIVDLKQDVVKLPDENDGDGVMPDIKIVQTHQDFLDNKDTQLNYAIDHMEKNIEN